MSKRKPIVFIVCTGVGHINRGYESFTEEAFEALRDNDIFELYLLKGAGDKKDHEIRISCIKRKTKFAALIAKITRKEVYWIEQFSFLLGMLSSLVKHKPVVIYYSDFTLGTWLWQLRRFLWFKYRLLFSNGAPNGPPFTRMDHIQQLLKKYFDDAVSKGVSTDIQTILPYGFRIDTENSVQTEEGKKNIRKQFGLPRSKKIIISVGAINMHHKRMDYVIKEFSLLNAENYYLLILGQFEQQSKEVLKLASKLLKENSYKIIEVIPEHVKLYLAASDYFILASLNEGLPRVLPEALFAGLLPIVHDYTVTHQTLNSFGVFRDLQNKMVLGLAIDEVNKRNVDKLSLIKYTNERYSWQNLKQAYIDMILKCMNN